MPSSPIVNEPLPQPQRWGEPELARLSAMVRQNSLFYWEGPQTAAMIEEFRHHYPLKYCFPCASGSASVHIAIASLRLRPGDEVIVTPITDMGSVIGILYQQGVPVFADLDPGTYNLDPADVRRRLTPKTRAIVAVHLAGNPCDLGALTALAREKGIPLIEDCAQAWGARWQGRPIGTIGDLACFSFNDSKHISCGDGGMVGSNRSDFGPMLGQWGDKYYDRITGNRDPEALAPNYRISEPQAAVAAAQLTKMAALTARRNQLGGLLTAGLAQAPGVLTPKVLPEGFHSYWFYLIRLELSRFTASRAEIAAALQAEGVAVRVGYIPLPVYKYKVFQNHGFFGGAWPVREGGWTTMDYRTVSCPVAEAILEDCLILTINEAMTDAYIGKVAQAVCAVANRFKRSAS